MKLKKLSALGSALVLSISSLLFIALPGVAHAAGVTLYWCDSASGDFNTAAHWNTNSSCSGGTQEVPVTGDSLIFSNTSLTGSQTVTNDISGLDIVSITFQGTNSSDYGFTLTGNAISLDAGITDTSSALFNQVSLNLTLTASQSITDTTGAFGLVIGNSSYSNTLNLGSNTLTLDSNFQLSGGGGSITLDSQLEGTGGLVMSGPSTGVYNFEAAANGYTGNISLEDGQAYVILPSSFGTGTITVSNGATLNTNFDTTSPTFSNSLVIGGNGFNGTAGALVVNDGCPAPGGSGSCTDTGTDTFSGPVTLTADTTVGTAGDTVDFTGALTCSTYTFTLASGSTGTLDGVSSCAASSSGSTGSTSGTKAPKTPDTGLALTSASVALPFFGSIAAATGLYIISRKVKQPITKRR